MKDVELMGWAWAPGASSTRSSSPYDASFSRLDIAYAIGRLSRYTQCPSQDHWHALARLMKYLRGTMAYAIEYSGFPVVLEGYSDANWILDSDETKSTSGYVFTLAGGAVT